MSDVFKEQLIKKKPSLNDKLAKSALFAGVVLILVVSMVAIPVFGVFIAFGAAFGAYVLIGRLNKEYEYIFTNGELDIDVIYNKSYRKRLFTGNVRDFEFMAHIDDQNHKNSIAHTNIKLDYSTGVPSERSYIFIANYNSKRTAFIIEPNDEMLEAIAKTLTRNKFYPKVFP